MHKLNWIIATLEEYQQANITPSPYARTITLKTPTGESKECILQHLDIHAENFEDVVRKMDKNNFISDKTLSYLLPEEVESD